NKSAGVFYGHNCVQIAMQDKEGWRIRWKRGQRPAKIAIKSNRGGYGGVCTFKTGLEVGIVGGTGCRQRHLPASGPSGNKDGICISAIRFRMVPHPADDLLGINQGIGVGGRSSQAVIGADTQPALAGQSVKQW